MEAQQEEEAVRVATLRAMLAVREAVNYQAAEAMGFTSAVGQAFLAAAYRDRDVLEHGGDEQDHARGLGALVPARSYEGSPGS